MFEKVKDIELHYEWLLKKLSDPSEQEDPSAYKNDLCEEARLAPLVSMYREYKKEEQALLQCKEELEIEKDEEMRTLLKEEIKDLTEKLALSEKAVKKLLLPKDPNEDKNVIMEIRSGVGGEESQLFAADLFRMYSRFAQIKGWTTEIVEYNASELGGANKITAIFSGKGVYPNLQFESGVHRVQRIPRTESQGRIQTSSATVVVMAEAEEAELVINPEDYRIDVFRASGNGGQCVNTTDSAVRLTHFPTSIVISCQDEKSQLKNRDKALKVLRSKLLDLNREKAQEEKDVIRRNHIGTGDRSEKIRTYNFPQGRVTDHRINQSFYDIEGIMNGELTELTEALRTDKEAKDLMENEEN